MSMLSGVQHHPAPLPRFFTTLLGREEAIASVCAMLAAPGTRLVTLTGPGGVGKTRLAVEIAGRIRDADAGRVVFVSLAPIRDPILALRAIAQALEIGSALAEETGEHLAAALAGEDVLLVLDNLEQVLAVAPALGRVLDACPGVRLLVTSRAPLGVAGERVEPVPPLTIPDSGGTSPEAAAATDAVALFLQRARMVAPAFVPNSAMLMDIAAMCRRLDGLPLAIELAAARVNLLPPRTLHARLDGTFQALATSLTTLPERQRTLAGTIAWSYDLLAPDEQMLLRRLGVFAGGFPSDLAASVVAEIPREDVSRLLENLLAHSLIRPVSSRADTPRYDLLETIRLFALERLAAAGEIEATNLAHATAMADIAGVARPHVYGDEQALWWARMTEESGNLRAAIAWAESRGEDVLVLRLIGSALVFIINLGMMFDVRDALLRTLASARDIPLPVRERALVAAGHFATEVHDHASSTRWFGQARELTRATGNLAVERDAVHGLGKVAFNAGRYQEAAAYFEESQAISVSLGEDVIFLRSQIATGMARYYLGDVEEAMACWDEARERAASAGDLTSEAIACGNLAAAALDQGDYPRARDLAARGIAIWRETSNLRDLPDALVTYGEASRELGRFADAHAALSEALEIMETATDAWKVYARDAQALVFLREGDLDRAARLFLEALEDAREIDSPHLLVDIPSHLAELALARGRPDIVASLLGADAAFRADSGPAASPATAARLERLRQQAREALGEAAYLAAMDDGGEADIDAVKRQMLRIARDLLGRQHPPVIASVAEDEPDGAHVLTAREREVLRLLVDGRSTAEIADALYLSPRTVGTYVGHILAKLDVPTRTAAVAEAVRRQLV